MRDGRLPSITAQNVYNSARLINVHAIDGRVYYVYINSVSVSGREIWRSKSRIVASCICGSTIAVVLESGILAVLLPQTIREPDCTSVVEESIGMTSHNLLNRQVAATKSGDFIAVNVSKASILIYEFDGSNLKFVRTLNVSESGFFQLTGDKTPYLWHLYETPDCYMLDLFEANGFSPVTFPDVPVARLPVSPPKENPQKLTTSRVFLHPCETQSLDGVLAYIKGFIFYVSWKSAIIGDVLSGVVWFPSTWFGTITTTRAGSESQTYVCSRNNGKIMQILSKEQGNDFQLLVSDPIGVLRFELRLQSWCHIAVIEGREEAVNDDTSDESEFRIISEPSISGRIRQLAFDARKRPWRMLTLNEVTLEARSSALPVRISTNKFGANNVSRVIYLPKLSVLLLSLVGGKGLRFLRRGSQAQIRDSMENWETHELQNLEMPFNEIISAGVLGNHTLALAGPEGVQFRTALSPFRVLAYVTPSQRADIIDAQFGDHFCIVRTVTSIYVVGVEAGFPTSVLIQNASVTFAKYQRSHLFVGLDTTLLRDKELVKVLLGDTEQDHIDIFGSFIDTDWPELKAVGVVLQFIEGPSGFALEGASFHEYVPTMYHISSDLKTNIVVYGYDGYVGHRRRAKDNEIVLTNLHCPLRTVGEVAGDSLLVHGVTFFVLSPHGCNQLIEFSGKTKDSYISSATVISDTVIAYTSRNELKFLAAADFGDLYTPAVLKSKIAPVLPKRVELGLLLVPSQRLLILHGENICMFYDSVTFESVLVSGIASAWCDSMAVWKFNSGGETFEQLLITNGRGLVESYSFVRDGPTLQCSCKYRAVVSHKSSTQRLKEVLHCRSDAIYLGRQNELVMAIPLPQHVTYRHTLSDEIRQISHAGNFLVVTSAKEISVLTSDRLSKVAGLALPDELSDEFDSESDDAMDVEDQSSADIEILSHAAAEIKGSYKKGNLIYILCLVYSRSRGRYRSIVSEFRLDTHSLAFWDYENQVQNLSDIITLVPDPERNPDLSHDNLRVYGVTRDYDVVLININPPEHVGKDLQEVY